MRAAEERQRGVKAGAGSRRAMEQRLPVVAVGGVTSVRGLQLQFESSRGSRTPPLTTPKKAVVATAFLFAAVVGATGGMNR